MIRRTPTPAAHPETPRKARRQPPIIADTPQRVKSAAEVF
jgi:hypothetical protein